MLPLTAVQLSQVNEALAADPENAELLSLRDELANLIVLTKQYEADQAAARPKAPKASSASDATHTFVAGEECMARHPSDGRWYAARILTVAGSAAQPVYSVLLPKQQTTHMLTAADLRPRQVHANGDAPAPAYVAPKKAPMTQEERERKRLKKAKKQEREAAKNREHDEKQSAWQKFQAKAVKKRYDVAGDKSQFKTPDDPYAKSTCTLSDAVGAGRGMTQQAARRKHTYAPAAPADP